MPETQAALKAVENVDKLISNNARKGRADWWQDQVTSGGAAPLIPKVYIDQNWFPGGQATLNYMWAVYEGSPPETAPAAVTKFFYKTSKQMNVGHGEGDQLDTEWHAFAPNEVKNLREWVVENKDEVWGMLYGGLPHPKGLTGSNRLTNARPHVRG